MDNDGICDIGETSLAKNFIEFLSLEIGNAQQRLQNNEFMVVKAAGNDGCDLGNINKPENLIIVGGSNGLVRDTNSMYGEAIDIAAPFEVQPYYSYDQGNYWILRGTSFSTPLVTGAAAIVWSYADKNLTAAEVAQRLKSTTRGVIPDFGNAGVLDIYAALGGEYEIKYDDGTYEMTSSPWTDEPGSEIAVRFTPPFYPVKITKVRFYVVSYGEPNTLFEARIYDGDSFPGTRLDSGNIIASGTTGDEWIDIDVSQQNITIDEGDFFVSMYWITAPGTSGEHAQKLGSDFNEPISNRSYWKHGASGGWYLRNDRNNMIRAMVTLE